MSSKRQPQGNDKIQNVPMNTTIFPAKVSTMASPPLKFRKIDSSNIPEETAEGYIHLVSPVKTSKNKTKYFNAVLQEAREFSELVSFKAELQPRFVEMEKNKTPVKLVNIHKIISRNRPGSFDIKVKSNTQVTSPARRLEFRFEQPPQTQIKLIRNVREMDQHYAKVCVEGKILEIGETVDKETKTGQSLKMKECVIADRSASIVLVLWEKDIDKIKIGKCYRLDNVTLRVWNENKSLSTSIDTAILEISDIGFVKESEDVSVTKVKEYDIEIESVGCTSVLQCGNSSCCKEVTDINRDLDTFKCPSCDMRMKSTKLKNVLKCEIVAKLDGQTMRYTIPEATLRSSPATKNYTNADKIEDILLEKTYFTIQVENFTIKTMRPTLDNIVQNILSKGITQPSQIEQSYQPEASTSDSPM